MKSCDVSNGNEMKMNRKNKVEKKEPKQNIILMLENNKIREKNNFKLLSQSAL